MSQMLLGKSKSHRAVWVGGREGEERPYERLSVWLHGRESAVIIASAFREDDGRHIETYREARSARPWAAGGGAEGKMVGVTCQR